MRDPALHAELARYAGLKGNLRFPLSEPMPHVLIRRVVQARLGECAKAARPAQR